MQFAQCHWRACGGPLTPARAVYDGVTMALLALGAPPETMPRDDADEWRIAALTLLRERGGLDGTNLHEVLHHAVIVAAGPALLEFILGCGADINYQDERGYGCLSWGPTAEAARMLLARGADIRVGYPLHRSMIQLKSGLLDVFLDAGIAVNALDEGGCTPLFMAAFSLTHWFRGSGFLEQERAVRRLLRLGADPTIADNEQRTPLDVLVTAAAGTGPIDELSVEGRVQVLQWWGRVIRLLARATAWWQRRHLLLAVRGRYATASAADADAAVA